jgi:hypothetical protein
VDYISGADQTGRGEELRRSAGAASLKAFNIFGWGKLAIDGLTYGIGYWQCPQ